jgi:hypothetical protein
MKNGAGSPSRGRQGVSAARGDVQVAATINALFADGLGIPQELVPKRQATEQLDRRGNATTAARRISGIADWARAAISSG